MEMNDRFSSFVRRCQEERTLLAFPEVDALMVGGSVGRQEDDRSSDLDLFILLSDCDTSAFLQTRMPALIATLGSPLMYRGPTFVPGFGYSFSALYEGFIVCQFNVNTVALLSRDPMRNQSRLMLFDKSGLYSKFLDDCKDLHLDAGSMFSNAFTFFWFRAISVARAIGRSNLWLAIRYMSDLRDQILLLKRLSSRSLPAGINVNLPSKDIEKHLGPASVAELADTLCTYARESVTTALAHCITTFSSQSRDYALAHGIYDSSQFEAAEIIKHNIWAACEIPTDVTSAPR